MTLNGAIMQLVEMRENSMMPDLFKPYFDKVIETISECVEPSEIPHWIPCSERLPEEETDVLVTRKFLGCKDGSHGWNSHIPPTTYVEVAQYFNGEWTALSDEYKIARNRHTNPIAWMPLPEPYKEGEQDEINQ